MMKKKKEQNLVQPQKYTVTTFVLQIVMGLVGLLFFSTYYYDCELLF